MQSDIVLQIFKSGALKDTGILEHIANLIRVEISDKNRLKNLNQIQILSYFLRTHQFKFQQLLNQQQLFSKISMNKKYTSYIQKLYQMDQKLKNIDNGKIYTLPNLNYQYQALKIAGISIGQNNYQYLSKVMRYLAIKNNAQEIRFWGKILGRKDYYVIQGISSNPYLNELSKDTQKYGIGVNDYSYWVANDILGEWIQLPVVSPNQVKISREFKYIFTGELEGQVKAFVPFQGKQKDLLKCVIARITHACYLAPRGLYRVNQNDPNAIEYEEIQQGFKLPEVTQLATLQNWVHLPADILSAGRTTHYIDPSLSQEEAETVKGELEEKEPIIERLRGITQDKPYQYNGFNAPNNWTVQLCGETIPVNLIGRQEGQSAIYGVALLKNLSWPGSATVGYRGGWTSIYVGYGHRITQELKIVKELADLQGEGQDIDERPEPNPSKPPVVEKVVEGGEEKEGGGEEKEKEKEEGGEVPGDEEENLDQ